MRSSSQTGSTVEFDRKIIPSRTGDETMRIDRLAILDRGSRYSLRHQEAGVDEMLRHYPFRPKVVPVSELHSSVRMEFIRRPCGVDGDAQILDTDIGNPAKRC